MVTFIQLRPMRMEGEQKYSHPHYCKFSSLVSPQYDSNGLWSTAMQGFNGRKEEDRIFFFFK